MLGLYGCTTVDLYEKTATMSGQEWKSGYKPSFTFEITDTTALYQVFFVMRHTDQYKFTNIFIDLGIKAPGSATVVNNREDVTLANNEGWIGTGMDDIYYHRRALGPPQPFRAGTYTFTLQQIMREDPLKYVLDAGIRLEKVR